MREEEEASIFIDYCIHTQTQIITAACSHTYLLCCSMAGRSQCSILQLSDQ